MKRSSCTGREILDLYAHDSQSTLLCTAAEILPEATTTHALLLLIISLRKHARCLYLIRTKCKCQLELLGFVVPTYIITITAATATSSFNLPSFLVMKPPALSLPYLLHLRRMAIPTVPPYLPPPLLSVSATESPSKLACHADLVNFVQLGATTSAGN